jgi:hypothetical protein
MYINHLHYVRGQAQGGGLSMMGGPTDDEEGISPRRTRWALPSWKAQRAKASFVVIL